jgi:hypothetical protein
VYLLEVFIIFKHLTWRFGIVLAGILGWPNWAYCQSVELTLTPRLCVLEASERECGGTVTLRWHAPSALSACLFQEGQAQPLQCWQKTALGEYTLSPRANRSVRFFLAPPNDNSVIVEAWFQVLQQQTAHRKRRNPWSFY